MDMNMTVIPQSLQQIKFPQNCDHDILHGLQICYFIFYPVVVSKAAANVLGRYIVQQPDNSS